MGDPVKGNANLEKGTAIATFGPDGKYAGGHAAIYVGQDQNGIQVLDQWAERPGRPAHPVAPRTIRWDAKTPSNNGTLFHVIKWVDRRHPPRAATAIFKIKKFDLQ